MTVFERLQTVEALAKAETGEAIPELARLERQATGWGCIALVGMFVVGVDIDPTVLVAG